VDWVVVVSIPPLSDCGKLRPNSELSAISRIMAIFTIPSGKERRTNAAFGSRPSKMMRDHRW
jgi:hypothetical protein